MDVATLQQKLINNKDDILKVIELLGFQNIKDKDKYCSFPRMDGDNPNGMAVYYDSLRYICFTRNDSGNLFSLVMKIRNVGFGQAINWICKKLGYDGVKFQKVTYPFGGFYRQFLTGVSRTEEDDHVYSESILDSSYGLAESWFKDGVDYLTQERYGIKYNAEDDAVYIPIRNIKGDLIGVKARANNLFCDHNKRFWSPYPYQKTCVVYGITQNYVNIVHKRNAIIFESEKAVMQLSSMGIDLGLAVGGHSISQVQARIIKSLMLNTVVVAFDEGICEDEILYETKKLISNVDIVKISHLGYIIDRDHEYLVEGSKDSPTDNGLDCFKGLYENCVTWIT